MRLKPVSQRSPLRIDDASAHRPSELADKDKLKAKTEDLLDRLEKVQAKLYADERFALLVVLQGRDTSGKSSTVRRVFGACNPIGCVVTSFKVPTPLELSHDFLWRIHHAVPAKGMIGIFDRSHYEDVLVVRVRELVPRTVWSRRYDEINEFERMLDRNGVKILKFFLHVSRDEQGDRLRERLADPDKNWKFRAGDLDDRDAWDDYTRAYRDALRRCSTPWAPWYVVPADNEKARDYLVARTVVETLEGLGLRYPTADPDALALAGELE